MQAVRDLAGRQVRQARQAACLPGAVQDSAALILVVNTVAGQAVVVVALAEVLAVVVEVLEMALMPQTAATVVPEASV
jgi:hypothetical protein